MAPSDRYSIHDAEALQLLLGRETIEGLRRGGLEVAVEVRVRGGEGDPERAAALLLEELRRQQGGLMHLQKLAAAGQLGAGVTHEVRNVMTGIVGFVQVAQRRLEEKAVVRVASLLELIESESRRCLEILSGFLEFSDRWRREAHSLDVRAVVRMAVRLVAHQLGMGKVQLEVDLPDEAPPVLGRERELLQVLVNLALNAMQAMQPHGGQVEVSVRSADGDVVIAVADSGPGIPESLRQRIFEPFFTTKPPEQGTGLGLYISRLIVEAHGGELSVASEEGRGAVFIIRLPAAKELAGESAASTAARRGAEG